MSKILLEIHGSLDEQAETMERVTPRLGPNDTWTTYNWKLGQRIQQRGLIAFRWLTRCRPLRAQP